ncbi:hypothetical protein ACOSQ3_008676 [Xanthoceras sorbifolium]
MGRVDYGLAFGRPKRLVLLFRVGIMLTIALGKVASEDQTEVPATGLLCISDCSTCPVICSTPPPAKEHLYPPLSPPFHHSPPESYYNSPLPTPHLSPPPPTPHWSPPPPPPQPAPSWPTYPTTPPPPFKYYNAPPSPGQARAPPSAGTGPTNYPYPYYYFYASEASPDLSCRTSFSILVFLCSVVLIGFA